MFKVLVLLLFPVLVYGAAADESSFYTPLAPFHCPQIEGDSETKGIFLPTRQIRETIFSSILMVTPFIVRTIPGAFFISTFPRKP